MKTNLYIAKVRATIFLPFIMCDWDLLRELNEIMKWNLPIISSNTPLVAEDGSVLSPGSWSLYSQDNSVKLFVQTQNQKLDIIFSANIDMGKSHDFWGDFIKYSKEIIHCFLKKSNSQVSRIAVAPSILFNDGADAWKDFLIKSFVIRDFDEYPLDYGDFSQTYRVVEAFDDKKFRFNFLSKFLTTNQIIVKDNVQNIIDQYNIELDINTAPDQNYSFSESAVNSFFDNAKRYVDKFLNIYFK